MANEVRHCICVVCTQKVVECDVLTVPFNSGNEFYYRKLRDYLSSEPSVADKITVVPKEDRALTGNFEVTIGRDVLHSKKKGMGRTETEAEKQAILEKIQELLAEE